MRSRQDIARELYEQSREWFQGRTCHPEPEQISRLIEGIQFVLLPNYFRPADASSVETCMEKLHALMSEQIHRAMYKRCPHKDGTTESRAHTDALADAVLQELPTLQQMLHEDVLETYEGDPAATGYDEIILTYPGLFALMVYRAAHVLHRLQIPLLPRMMTEHAHKSTGIDIHPGAQLGRGIMIDHGTGIVIGETAVVGNHVKLYQGVTLGALYFPRAEDGSMVRRTRRHPTVEDFAVIYSNATVLGGDTVIGHHSVIGSNAWVTSSVPPYSKVRYSADRPEPPAEATPRSALGTT
ncbi:MAG: serine acetyltransferase [Alicyclobacillus sp.]|nr:serine acetyltransferase [Alicyclobacillus sp.]